jgi:hypothetical protein
MILYFILNFILKFLIYLRKNSNMTIQELKDRVKELANAREAQIASLNMTVGRLQEAQEQLALAQARDAIDTKIPEKIEPLSPTPEERLQPITDAV